ncbi:7S RNA binding protein [Aureococcus anophagefferens]|nr:7S RNA binding protein [Aureococcus anophagefferens]
MAEPVVEYDTYGPPRTSAFASSNPGLSGWLYKSSGGKRTILVKFDRRWFVLDGAVLRYYASDSLETEKGAIPLGDVVEVKTLVQGSATFGTFPPAECRFELVTSARNWVLAVDPKEDINALKKTWVDGISAATGLVPRRSGLSFYAASAGRDAARRGAHSGFLWMRKANKKLGWKERLVALDGDVLRVFKEQRGARICVAEIGPLAGCVVERVSASGRWTTKKTFLRFLVTLASGETLELARGRAEFDRRFARSGPKLSSSACGAETARDEWLERLQAASEGAGEAAAGAAAAATPPKGDYGDPASCEIFSEHGTFGFLKCARCGVPRASHWRCEPAACPGLPPCGAKRSGWLLVRKRKDVVASVVASNWKRRYARLAGSELRWYHSDDVAEADARHVVDAETRLYAAEDTGATVSQDAEGVEQFLVVVAGGQRLTLAAESGRARGLARGAPRGDDVGLRRARVRARAEARCAEGRGATDDAFALRAQAAPRPAVGTFDERGAASRF